MQRLFLYRTQKSQDQQMQRIKSVANVLCQIPLDKSSFSVVHGNGHKGQTRTPPGTEQAGAHHRPDSTLAAQHIHGNNRRHTHVAVIRAKEMRHHKQQ